MNREIKFRAKSIQSGVWRYGFYTMSHDHYCIEWFDSNVPTLGCQDYIDPQTLGQYTGLKDKNGAPIYEGDVVRVSWNDGAQPLWVEYQAPQFVMRFKTPSGAKSKAWSTFDLAPSEKQLFEVIGNIYENPELLDAR